MQLTALVTQSPNCEVKMSDSKDQGSVLKFSHVPYNERWEPLKPAIVKIYIEENNRISQLAQRMKDEYDFDAQSVSKIYPRCCCSLLISYFVR